MIKLAVIGAGVMGASHARIASRLRDVEVAAVVDPDEARGRALAGAAGARWAASLTSGVAHVDAAVVATPTDEHVSVAMQLLERGVHVLIEKPLSRSSHEARRIVAEAERRGLTLMVGHVERFNPAYLGLAPLLRDVLHVSTARISPYSTRVGDDVVLDLMIHDLDLVLAIAGSRIAQVSSVGSRSRSTTTDVASATLTFESGMTANLVANRVGQHKIRRMEITQTGAFVTADLLRQHVEVSRVTHSEYLSEAGSTYRQSGVVEIPFLDQRGEPLSLELEHFVECLRTGRPPAVPGTAGVAALEAVEQVMDAMVVTDRPEPASEPGRRAEQSVRASG